MACTVNHTETKNVTPTTGGKVHLPSLTFDFQPLCNTYGPAGARTRYRVTDAEVTCKPCAEQLRRRELFVRNNPGAPKPWEQHSP